MRPGEYIAIDSDISGAIRANWISVGDEDGKLLCSWILSPEEVVVKKLLGSFGFLTNLVNIEDVSCE